MGCMARAYFGLKLRLKGGDCRQFAGAYWGAIGSFLTAYPRVESIYSSRKLLVFG